MFIWVTLGTVDVAYMLFDWALANKATYIGARVAVVSNPVAQNITNNADLGYTASQLQNIGHLCYDPTTGNQNGNCPSTGLVVCTSTACTPSTYGFDATVFTNAGGTGIFDKMKGVFPRLQPANVTVSYQTIDNDASGFSSFGFVMRPGGLPMKVTVQIKCMTHPLYFIGGLMNWVFPAPAGCPAGTPAGPSIPAFATTLTSEDMFTN
jgi:hypothetical protein